MTKTDNSIAAIRKTFLDYFASKDHVIANTSSLIPDNDNTLLFTNSGMVQFKDVLLGNKKLNYVRAASSQFCVRAGGKHNDFENVGYTARHHTFFEMLGNWSFGDYFKKESLKMSWELLTQVYKLPKERLLVTVYQEDQESYDIWTKEIGLSEDKVICIGDNKGGKYQSDNFWMMGDTGPCGPCSEIFYDHGPSIAGGPPGSPDQDGDRFVEIWNNVFMEFNMDVSGELTPLPAKCVDTGMGLERLAAVLQGVHSNYQIDTFQSLIKRIAKLTQTEDISDNSLKVIADHARSATMLTYYGCYPSNTARGYVLRRIIRRAVRHGYKLGQNKPFLYKLVDAVIDQLSEGHPQLQCANNIYEALADRIEEYRDLIAGTIEAEEQKFFKTLKEGMKLLNAELQKTSDMLPGNVAFKLHDTYGFPLDMTSEVCRENNRTVDTSGFNTAMQEQKDRSKAASKFKKV